MYSFPFWRCSVYHYPSIANLNTGMIRGAVAAFCIACVAESIYVNKVAIIIIQILGKPQISIETSSEQVLAATFYKQINSRFPDVFDAAQIAIHANIAH